MMLSKTLVMTALSGATLAASLSNAYARPTVPQPATCKPWI